jgi:hypothetical protein
LQRPRHSRPPPEADGALALAAGLAAGAAVGEGLFRFSRRGRACTVGFMATEPAGLPAESEGVVVPIEEIGDAGGMTLDDLLAEIAATDPIVLPKPAAAYLEEARDAGET